MKIGDWVIRTDSNAIPEWTKEAMARAYRIDDSSVSGYSIFLNDFPYPSHSNWSRSYFRLATPKEIAAVPFKEGDWVYCKSQKRLQKISPHAALVGRTGPTDYPDWRHATPEEYRSKMGKDENLEDSRDDLDQSVDKEKLEKVLASLEKRVSQNERNNKDMVCSLAVHERMLGSIENEPEPESQPVLYRERFSKEVVGFRHADGKNEACGLYTIDGSESKARYDIALEPVPETELTARQFKAQTDEINRVRHQSRATGYEAGIKWKNREVVFTSIACVFIAIAVTWTATYFCLTT